MFNTASAKIFVNKLTRTRKFAPSSLSGCRLSTRFLSLYLCLWVAASGAHAPPAVPSPNFSENPPIGAVDGSFRVDEAGAATYVIPLSLPKGAAGVAPQLSFSYSSQSGNGLLGHGWSVAGISRIVRCRQTLQQDGQARPITWGRDDRFCLNGQRLMLVKGDAYGDTGAHYKTELDQQVLVRSIGGTAGHPDYFELEAKDGSVVTFGGTENAVVMAQGHALAWAQSRLEDSIGNRINYSYEGNAATGHRVRSIQYAYPSPRTDFGPAAQVKFDYESGRRDPISSFVGGKAVKVLHRLSRVTIYNDSGTGSGEFRRYNLAYQADDVVPTDSVSRLESIEECVQSICIPKTSFTWPTLALQSDSSEALVADNKGRHLNLGRGAHVLQQQQADIDGDGKLDLVWLQYQEGSSSQSLRYALADSEGGYSSPMAMGNSAFAVDPRVSPTGVRFHLLDYNGDGRQDVLAYQRGASDGSRWRLFLSSPQRAGGWGLEYHGHLDLDSYTKGWGRQLEFKFADMDGDGLPDAYAKVGSALRVHYLRPAGRAPTSNVYYAFESDFTSYEFSGLPAAEENHHWSVNDVVEGGVGDFTGDGQADLVMRATKYRRVWIEWGSYYNSTAVSTEQMIFTRKNGGFERYATVGEQAESKVADINNDGLSDVVYKDSDSWKFQLNSGVGLRSPVEVSDIPVGLEVANVFLVDINRDGFLDVAWRTQYRTYYRSWSPSESEFDARVHVFAEGFLPLDEGQTVLADANGDGWVDILSFKSTSPSWNMISSRQQGALSPNVLTGVTDGLANEIQVTYQQLTTSSHYSRLDPGEWRQVNLEPVCVEMKSGPATPELCHTPVQHTIDTSEFYRLLNTPFVALPEGNEHLSSPGSPVLEIHAPLPVVTRVARSQPSGIDVDAIAETSYYYEQMKFQAAGRGSLGFRKLTAVDHQAGIITETTYRQDWPFIGSPLKTVVKSLEGHTLSHAANTWSLKQFAGPDGTRYYQTFVREAVEQSFSLADNGSGQGERLSEVSTSSDYDEYGNLRTMTVVTEAAGKTHQKLVENKYGNDWHRRFGRLASTTVTTNEGANADARTSAFTYITSGDKRGLLLTESVLPSDTALAITTSYRYDDFGNISQTIRSAEDGTVSKSDVTRFDSGRYVQSITNALGHTIHEVLERNHFGAPVRIANINKLVATITYDEMGFEYLRMDETGAWTWSARERCDGGITCPKTASYRLEKRIAGGSRTFTYFDRNRRPIREATLGFDGRFVHVDTEYNDQGQVQRVSTPYFEGSSPAGWTSHSYDALGRNTGSLLPNGHSGGTVSYDGIETLSTNALEHTSRERKNLQGQLAQVTDHLGGTVHYQYDLSGNLISTTTDASDAAPVTVRMCYDALGRKVAMHDPDKGGFLGNGGAACQDVMQRKNIPGWWYYQYNGIGELVSQTDPKGQSHSMTYDALGRMLTRTDRRADGSVEGHTHWYYDGDMSGRSRMGDLGNVTYVVQSYDRIDTQCGGSNHCTAHLYDALGRRTDTLTYLPGVNVPYQTGVAYDAIGRPYQHYDVLQGLVMSNSGTQQHYNDYGYKDRITDLASGDLLYKINSMNAWGNVVEEERGSGAVTRYDYDPYFGRLKQQNAAVGAIFPIQDIAYEWDILGNLTSRHNQSVQQGNKTLKDLRESFCYDGLNRLIKSYLGSLDPNCSITNAQQDVEYNGLGNIIRKVGVGGYQYTGKNAGPHAVTNAGSASYSYDANGNMVSGDGRALKYSTFDRLTEASKGAATSRFRYGPDRSRYQRVDVHSNTTTHYLGSVERIHVAGSNTVTWRRSVAGAMYTITTDLDHNVQGETEKTFVYRDHLGSTDVITDRAGTVLQSQSFDAWGQRRSSELWTALTSQQLSMFDTRRTMRGFTDHEHIDAVGLIHMNGRAYDPKLARFIQADPFIQSATNTQSYNRYSYLWNNPLNATDPSGFFLKSLWNEVRPFVGTVVAVALTALCQACGIGAYMAIGGVSGAVGALANGTNILQGATLGAWSGGAAFAGGWVGVATSGALSAGINGANAGRGFLAAGIGGYLGGMQGNWSFIAATVGGGLASEVTGGKFKNGAATAAFMWALSGRGRSLNDNTNDSEHRANAHTKDGRSPHGRGSFTDEKIAEIDGRLDKVRGRIVGKSGSGDSHVPTHNTAAMLTNDAALMSISKDYDIEISARLATDGTVKSIDTIYHHSSAGNTARGNESLWHTHPGRSFKNNLIGEKIDIRSLSTGDILNNRNWKYAAYSDGSMVAMHVNSPAEWLYENGSWGKTGRSINAY